MIKLTICCTAADPAYSNPITSQRSSASSGAMMHSHTGDEMENEVLSSQRVSKEDVREVSEQLGSDRTHLACDAV